MHVYALVVSVCARVCASLCVVLGWALLRKAWWFFWQASVFWGVK